MGGACHVLLVVKPPLQRVIDWLVHPWDWLVCVQQRPHVVARRLTAGVGPDVAGWVLLPEEIPPRRRSAAVAEAKLSWLPPFTFVTLDRSVDKRTLALAERQRLVRANARTANAWSAHRKEHRRSRSFLFVVAEGWSGSKGVNQGHDGLARGKRVVRCSCTFQRPCHNHCSDTAADRGRHHFDRGRRQQLPFKVISEHTFMNNASLAFLGGERKDKEGFFKK